MPFFELLTSIMARAWNSSNEIQTVPHGMCYSHYVNGVRNGAISIAQWGLLSDCYKANPIGQWGKNLVIVMGFVGTFEPSQWRFFKNLWPSQNTWTLLIYIFFISACSRQPTTWNTLDVISNSLSKLPINPEDRPQKIPVWWKICRPVCTPHPNQNIGKFFTILVSFEVDPPYLWTTLTNCSK